MGRVHLWLDPAVAAGYMAAVPKWRNGRRRGFKIPRRKVCRFESGLGYQPDFRFSVRDRAGSRCADGPNSGPPDVSALRCAPNRMQSAGRLFKAWSVCCSVWRILACLWKSESAEYGGRWLEWSQIRQIRCDWFQLWNRYRRWFTPATPAILSRPRNLLLVDWKQWGAGGAGRPGTPAQLPHVSW
jgi:hypothetical protein